MIGAEVTELIQGYTIAKTLENTESELMRTIFPHRPWSREWVLMPHTGHCPSWLRPSRRKRAAIHPE
jgi:hypothetical protein